MKEKGHLHPVNLRVERNMEVIFCSFFLLVDDAGVKLSQKSISIQANIVG